MVTPSKPPSSPAPQSAPSPHAILCVYIALGALLSILTGRQPGTLPDEILLEMAPSFVVICAFLVSYSVWDVMATGVAQSKHGIMDKSYAEWASNPIPEEIHLAQRVQTNQIEQFPVFVVGTLGFSLYVNGTVGAFLALIWVLLRRKYASVYRNSAGLLFSQKGLATYTIPAYFVANSMLMGTAVHAARYLWSAYL